jgi:hypothetical protein
MRTSQPGEEKDTLRGRLTLGEKPRMDRSLVAPVHEICLASQPASVPTAEPAQNPPAPRQKHKKRPV